MSDWKVSSLLLRRFQLMGSFKESAGRYWRKSRLTAPWISKLFFSPYLPQVWLWSPKWPLSSPPFLRAHRARPSPRNRRLQSPSWNESTIDCILEDFCGRARVQAIFCATQPVIKSRMKCWVKGWSIGSQVVIVLIVRLPACWGL